MRTTLFVTLLALFSLRNVLAEDGDIARTVEALEKARMARIAEVKRERTEVLKDMKKQEALVSYLEKWAESETDRRIRARPMRRGVDSEYLERLWDRRQLILSRVTNFPYDSRAAISKGRALNELIIACGPTASSRLRLRSRGADINGVSDEVRAQVARLKNSLSEATVPDGLLDQIRFTRGLTGPKLTGRLDGTVLDLEWPLKLREDTYRYLREEIEQARDKALKELKSGKPISPETAAELMVAVEQLKIRVYSDGNHNIRIFKDYQKFRDYRIADEHMNLLMQGAARFVQATKLEHVRVEPFTGATVEELIAYMHRNALQFAPADQNSEIAHWQLFELFVTWFVDLQLADQAIDQERNELAALQQREARLESLEDSIRSSASTAIIAGIQAFSVVRGERK